MNFSWPWPRIAAHRGAGTVAPENTLAALRKGYELGYRAVEFDVMLSADEVPVLMHDADFGRTIRATGSVATSTAAQMQRMDAGLWHSAAYAGEPVPLYADVLRFCRQHGIWMNVEIKPAPGHEQRTGAIVGAMTQAFFADVENLAELPLFSSFSRAALHAARAAAPRMRRGLLMDRVGADWRDQLQTLDCVALHCNHLHLDAGIARAVRDAGHGLFCYTVNTAERVRELFSWGVDGVCTDRIDLIGPDVR